MLLALLRIELQDMKPPCCCLQVAPEPQGTTQLMLPPSGPFGLGVVFLGKGKLILPCAMEVINCLNRKGIRCIYWSNESDSALRFKCELDTLKLFYILFSHLLTNLCITLPMSQALVQALSRVLIHLILATAL